MYLRDRVGSSEAPHQGMYSRALVPTNYPASETKTAARHRAGQMPRHVIPTDCPASFTLAALTPSMCSAYCVHRSLSHASELLSLIVSRPYKMLITHTPTQKAMVEYCEGQPEGRPCRAHRCEEQTPLQSVTGRTGMRGPQLDQAAGQRCRVRLYSLPTQRCPARGPPVPP